MFDELKSAARRLRDDHALRRLRDDCRRLLSERGQGDSVALAGEIVQRWSALDDARQAAFFAHLARDHNPDPQAVLADAQAYAADPGPAQLARLVRSAEPPRQELLRRLNRAPGGTAAIVRMRRALLARLPKDASLAAVEDDLLHLLSSWFNPGFLEMRRVDWNAPARLLEQIIRHEAVHEIDGWDDLRRRLLPDRRCFAFFHPQLPDEPLIFVEVALLPEMPVAIAPLIDKSVTAPLEPAHFKVAAFYSISNCEPGLRGVSLGNFLIKRVAVELQRELPQLRTFCTLSPMPGFAAWLAKPPAFAALPGAAGAVAERAAQAHAALAAACDGNFSRLHAAAALRALPPAAAQALTRLAAVYLVHATRTPQGDPVARFHLDNGARLERLNPLADLSRRGLRQSCAMMVNYLYDLDRVEARHEGFTRGRIATASVVASLP
ncbi:malonyl-CoA decarboxylase family protein [Azohydromonas sp.]|uniref:malonyl-CoA decarboxylase domain-containing protein n=1 Tax=Azohydromonas sp. TaxID=1872666 RepID=UPI002B8CBB63|nr:malonyl-CoA decarboxylase family protein [Azohydromonas sp.]HMM87052.1 malonyl-CoA decarboxylase family protein [Azohydromonas sp.]